jgi:hydroxymethylpyrimidine pyrophosphatase-like HAD family hydrolase
MTQPCFIFDVDGVLVDHWSPPQTTTKILKLIATKFKHSPLIFITGRDPAWLTQNIIKPIIQIAPTKPKLLAICEHGGVKIGPPPNFKPQPQPGLTINPSLKNQFKTLVSQHSNTMFVDTSKLTMLTAETRSDIKPQQFKQAQLQLKNQLAPILKQLSQAKKLKIVLCRQALDIIHRKLGKAFATKQALNWIKQNKYQPTKFYVLGDSQTDLEIGQVLKTNKLSFEFIFVGNKQNITKQPDFPLTFTKKPYTSGTLNFLKKLT